MISFHFRHEYDGGLIHARAPGPHRKRRERHSTDVGSDGVMRGSDFRGKRPRDDSEPSKTAKPKSMKTKTKKDQYSIVPRVLDVSGSRGKRNTRYLPAETYEYLMSWMTSRDHVAHPHPTDQEKVSIMADTGIGLVQLINWFNNNRMNYQRFRVVKAGKAAAAASSIGSKRKYRTTTCSPSSGETPCQQADDMWTCQKPHCGQKNAEERKRCEKCQGWLEYKFRNQKEVRPTNDNAAELEAELKVRRVIAHGKGDGLTPDFEPLARVTSQSNQGDDVEDGGASINEAHHDSLLVLEVHYSDTESVTVVSKPTDYTSDDFDDHREWDAIAGSSNSDNEEERRQNLLAKLAGRRQLLTWVQLSRVVTEERIRDILKKESPLPLFSSMHWVGVESPALTDDANLVSKSIAADFAQDPCHITVLFNEEKRSIKVGSGRTLLDLRGEILDRRDTQGTLEDGNFCFLLGKNVISKKMEKCHLIVDILKQGVTVALVSRSTLEEGVSFVKNAIALVNTKNKVATMNPLLIRHNMSSQKMGRTTCKCAKTKCLKLYCICFQRSVVRFL